MASDNDSSEPGPSPVGTPDLIDELTITVNHTTGNIGVKGPIKNRLLAYGMLGVAFEVVLQQSLGEAANPSRLVLPRFGRG